MKKSVHKHTIDGNDDGSNDDDGNDGSNDDDVFVCGEENYEFRLTLFISTKCAIV